MDVPKEVKDCSLECVPDKVVLLIGTNDMASQVVIKPVKSTDKCASVAFKQLLLSARSHFPTLKVCQCYFMEGRCNYLSYILER